MSYNEICVKITHTNPSMTPSISYNDHPHMVKCFRDDHHLGQSSYILIADQ